MQGNIILANHPQTMPVFNCTLKFNCSYEFTDPSLILIQPAASVNIFTDLLFLYYTMMSKNAQPASRAWVGQWKPSLQPSAPPRASGKVFYWPTLALLAGSSQTSPSNNGLLLLLILQRLLQSSPVHKQVPSLSCSSFPLFTFLLFILLPHLPFLQSPLLPIPYPELSSLPTVLLRSI